MELQDRQQDTLTKSNDTTNSPVTAKIDAIRKLDWLKIFSDVADRMTRFLCHYGLLAHVFLFLMLPIVLFDYINTQLFHNNSHPNIENGALTISVSADAWNGYFWFVNLYLSLFLVVCALFLFYKGVMNVYLKKSPPKQLAFKAAFTAMIAAGWPLKFAAHFMMKAPESYAPRIDMFGQFDLSTVALSGPFSLEGAWFFSRFAVLTPVYLGVALILRAMIHYRDNARVTPNGGENV